MRTELFGNVSKQLNSMLTITRKAFHPHISLLKCCVRLTTIIGSNHYKINNISSKFNAIHLKGKYLLNDKLCIVFLSLHMYEKCIKGQITLVDRQITCMCKNIQITIQLTNNMGLQKMSKAESRSPRKISMEDIKQNPCFRLLQVR